MIVDMAEFLLEERGGLSIFQSPVLASVPGVVHGFTTRAGGVSEGTYSSLNLGAGSGDDPAQVRENRRLLCRAAGRDPAGVRLARQVHGDAVAVIRDTGAGKDAPVAGVDALATGLPDLTLLVLSADCTVILLVAPAQRAVAAIHAGWKGTVAGVAGSAVRAMTEAFQARPETLIAAVGPAIGPCCYEVDTPVISAVRHAFPGDAGDLLAFTDSEHAQFDLWEANRRQLLRSGLRDEAISVAGLCTRCNAHQFYSQRGEGLRTGRFGAFISLT
jgi:YfiH family protein